MNLILNQVKNIIQEEEKIKQTYINLSNTVKDSQSYTNENLLFLEIRLIHIYTLHFYLDSHPIATFVQNIHSKIIYSNFIENKFTKRLCDQLYSILQNCKKYFEEMEDHSLENTVNFIHYYLYVLRIAYFTSFDVNYLKDMDCLQEKLGLFLIFDCFDK